MIYYFMRYVEGFQAMCAMLMHMGVYKISEVKNKYISLKDSDVTSTTELLRVLLEECYEAGFNN